MNGLKYSGTLGKIRIGDNNAGKRDSKSLLPQIQEEK
jgi:hypothetical protein